MYDTLLKVLGKERSLRIWMLDNNCVYKKHVMAASIEELLNLAFYTPTWHALNHIYVRTAAGALRMPSLTWRAAMPGEKLRLLPAIYRAARRRNLRARVVRAVARLDRDTHQRRGACRRLFIATRGVLTTCAQHRRQDVIEFALQRLSKHKLMRFPELLNHMHKHASDKFGAYLRCCTVRLFLKLSLRSGADGEVPRHRR